MSVTGLPSVEDGVSEVEGNSEMVSEAKAVENVSVLVSSSVVEGKSVGKLSVLVGSSVVEVKTVSNVSVLIGTSVEEGKIVGNVSVLIESDGTISMLEDGMIGLTSVEEAGIGETNEEPDADDGSDQVKVPLVDVAG